MVTRRALLFIILLSLPIYSGCRRTIDESEAETLLQEIEMYAEEYPEADISVVVHDLSTRATVEIESDRLMPAGALLHLPILIEAHRQATAGHFSMRDTVRMTEPQEMLHDTLTRDAEVLAEEHSLLTPSTSPTLMDLVSEMVTASSDSAAARLLTLISPDSVALTSIRMGAAGVSLRLTGDTTIVLADSIDAVTVLALLSALAQGRAVNPRMDHDILTLMLRHQNRSMIPSGLPPEASVAHLSAQGDAYYHDAAIVYPRSGGPYILIIMTTDVEEEASAAGAAISRMVYRRLRGGGTR